MTLGSGNPEGERRVPSRKTMVAVAAATTAFAVTLAAPIICDPVLVALGVAALFWPRQPH